MAATTKCDGFSAEEGRDQGPRQEVTAQAHGPDGAAAVLTKIDKMPDDDNAVATRFQQLVREIAPGLVPRT